VTVIVPVLYSLLITCTAKDGDDRLAEVDAGEAELGGIDHAAGRGARASP